MPSRAQLEARALFAKRARSGAFSRSVRAGAVRVSGVFKGHRVLDRTYSGAEVAKTQLHFYTRAGYHAVVKKVKDGYAIFSKGAYTGKGKQTEKLSKSEISRLRRGDL